MFAASRAGADCFQVWRGTFRFYGMSNVGLQTFSGEYCECSQSGLGETDKLLQESSRGPLDRECWWKDLPRNNKKFMQTLETETYRTIAKEASQRGATVQELLRAVIIPDWLTENRKKWSK